MMIIVNVDVVGRRSAERCFRAGLLIWLIASGSLMTPARALEPTDTALRTAIRFFDGFTWSGEFRVRADMIFTDTTTATSDRYRGRFGLCVGFTKRVNEHALFGFRLKTGTSGLPTAGYQSFDNVALGKVFGLDHAYVDLTPFDAAAADRSMLEAAGRSMRFVLGKQPRPFASATQLVWDNDVALEGASELLKISSGRFTGRFTAGQYFLDDNAAPDDPYALSNELGLTYAVTPNVGLSMTAGIHHFVRPYSIDATSQSGTNFRQGEHAGPSGFSVLDLSSALTFPIGSKPARLTGGFVRNMSATIATPLGSVEDSAWLVELVYGKAAEPGTWEVGINYRSVQADAVLGQFGNGEPQLAAGGTDVRGLNLSAAYALWKNVIWSASGYRCRPVSTRMFDHRMRIESTILVKF